MFTWVLPQLHQYPNLSEGADCIGGQLCGDKECPFSGVTKYGRVWRKVLESNAWSVVSPLETVRRRGCETSSIAFASVVVETLRSYCLSVTGCIIFECDGFCQCCGDRQFGSAQC